MTEIHTFKPHEIEAESFRIIDSEVPEHGFPPREWSVVRRIIHASADLEFASLVEFHPELVDRALEALRRGCDVAVDVNMVLAGLDQKRLAALGGRAHCLIGAPEVAQAAAEEGITRSAAAMRRLTASECPGIVAVGNAPTALAEILRLHREKGISPVVLGVPVGFVGAAEAKEALRASGLVYLTCRGRKGGSPVAASALNALLRLAAE